MERGGGCFILRSLVLLVLCTAASAWEVRTMSDAEKAHVFDTACPTENPYMSNGECVDDCPSHEVPDKSNNCVRCPEETPFVLRDQHVCIAECPAGSAPDDVGDCVRCELQDSGTPYVSDGKCLAECPAGSVPGASNTCAPCTDPKPYVSQTLKECVTTCPKGEAPGWDRDCAPCEGDKYADHTAHKCVSQCTGDTPYVSEQDCVSTCPPGQAPDLSHQCAACPEGTPYVLHNVSFECVAKCPPDLPYVADGNCAAQCQAGAAPKNGFGRDRNECVACDEGYYADHTKHKCVTECSGDTPFIFINDCVAECPSGTGPIGGDGASRRHCALCPDSAPYKDADTAMCVSRCPDGSVSTDNNDCVKCDEGTYSDQTTQECVIECPLGSFAVGKHCSTEGDDNTHGLGEAQTSNPCYSRVDLPYQENGLCVDTCASGSAPTSNKICEPCPAHQLAYQDKDVCVDECPANAPYNSTRDCVSKCPGGTAADDDKNCVVCDPSMPYSHHVDGHEECVRECPVGHAPSETNECLPCSEIRPYNGEYVDTHAQKCVEECPEILPFNHSFSCVSVCPSGQAPKGGEPEAAGECTQCTGDTPYALAITVNGTLAANWNHTCVSDCPNGTMANLDAHNCDHDQLGLDLHML